MGEGEGPRFVNGESAVLTEAVIDEGSGRKRICVIIGPNNEVWVFTAEDIEDTTGGTPPPTTPPKDGGGWFKKKKKKKKKE